MRLPKPLFVIINPVVALLLKSPMHRFWSSGLLLMTFRGRRSKRLYTTPLRYIEADGAIRCFSTPEGRWWRNLRGGARVTLRIQGRERPFEAHVIENEPHKIRAALEHYLAQYPQDAAYHSISLRADKSLAANELERASEYSVLIEARPLPGKTTRWHPAARRRKMAPTRFRLAAQLRRL